MTEFQGKCPKRSKEIIKLNNRMSRSTGNESVKSYKVEQDKERKKLLKKIETETQRRRREANEIREQFGCSVTFADMGNTG